MEPEKVVETVDEFCKNGKTSKISYSPFNKDSDVMVEEKVDEIAKIYKATDNSMEWERIQKEAKIEVMVE